MPNADSNSKPVLIIVGNGMVGHALCSKLVSSDAQERYRIVVFGDEPRPAYDRVHLTDFFSGRSAHDLELASKEWYSVNNLELHTNERVVLIDREDRSITTSADRKMSYDKVVLATGSLPFIPPIDGIDLDGVFPYRTIEDLVSIREYSKQTKAAAVLGGGLLGLEAAKALYDLGLETHVIEMAPALMPRQLDADGADVLQQKIEQLGVHVHLLKRTQKIVKQENKRVLQFDRGAELSVEMVIVSAGIRPRDKLANTSGLEIGPRGGIVVDDRLATSDPNIFAIGECALHRETIYGLVSPGYQMADVLAANLMDGHEQFLHGDQSARLKLMGVAVSTIGEPLGETTSAQIVNWQTSDTSRKLIVKKGRIVGAIAVGDWPESDRVRQAIAVGQRLWAWNLNRFEATGALWKPNPTDSVADWPETATVCSCLQVTRGTLSNAQRNGCKTVEELAAATSASTVCGSCQPLLSQLAGTTPKPVHGWRGLASTSGIALCVLLIWLVGPIPFSQTVIGIWHRIDFIWRDAAWKQVTGFTLLAISLMSLVLPLRKRIKRFSFGDFGFWRTVHSALGLLTVFGLIVHTGLHLGDNLNFVLAFSFLGLNLVGALTGAVTAWEYRATGATARMLRSWRPRLTKAHLLFGWPLPVLLIFHIASAYYY